MNLTRVVSLCLAGCFLGSSTSTSFAQADNRTSVWGDWPTWGDQGNGTYLNPVLPSDYSDIDCIRVGADYYAMSSTFQYSPGQVILKSKDLVNWEIAGHAVPDVSVIGPAMTHTQMSRYGTGIWAGGMAYHDGKFWVYFGTIDEGYFMTTATDVAGPWAPLTKILASSGWNDCAPFWDEDGQGYLVGTHVSNNYTTYVWKLSADGKQLLKQDGTPAIPYTTGVQVNQGSGREASKLYKVNGVYYHFFSESTGDGRVVKMQRSTTSPMGPYTEVKQITAGNRTEREPNQGGIVQTVDGKWFFYTHHGSGDWEGRCNSLLPVEWVDGWPQIGTPRPDGLGGMTWSGVKPVANTPLATPKTSDEFTDPALALQWEWNYQPRADKWSLTERPGWLRLKAFTPLSSDDLLKAGNTLTQRVFRTNSNEAITKLDLSGMADGQKAGLCHLSTNTPATFGVRQSGATRTLELKVGGTVTTGPTLSGSTLWLRSTWGLNGVSQFSYSTDGTAYTNFGPPYQLRWASYRGDRLGLYSFNNLSISGQADFDFLRYRIQPTAPSIVETIGGNGFVSLRWSQVREASGYQVERATTAGGPFSPVGAATTGLVFTDSAVTNGTPYVYRVTTVPVAPATAATSAVISVTPTSPTSINAGLGVRLRFDESSGATARDVSGNQRNATLVNGPSWGAGRVNNALTFNGTNQHATLPDGIVSGLSGDFSITTWVKVNTVNNWARIFDFGTGTNAYMFLTTKNGSATNMRFAITTSGGNEEQVVTSSDALPTGAWTHVALTVAGNTATLYVNGVVAGTNSSLTLKPSALGDTTRNYLGRSQYNDPYFGGALDEFQIAARAFTAAEVAAMAAPPNAPTGVTALPRNATIDLDWNAVSSASGYNVRRATASGGPYEMIAENVTGTSYVDSGLTNGTRYHYVVTTASSVVESAYSASASAVPVAPPSSPTGLGATGNDAQIALAWTAAGGATGYKVRRALTSGSTTPIQVGSVTTTNYTDASVNNGTTYFYTVTATNAGGESSPSNEVSATPSPPISGAEVVPPTITVAGANANIAVRASVRGHTYQLQFTDTLATNSWQNLGSAQPGTGENLQFVAPAPPAGVSKRFYRVVIQRM